MNAENRGEAPWTTEGVAGSGPHGTDYMYQYIIILRRDGVNRSDTFASLGGVVAYLRDLGYGFATAGDLYRRVAHQASAR